MAKPKDPVDKKKVEKPVEVAPKLNKKAEGVDKVKAESKIERKKGEVVDSGKDERKFDAGFCAKN